MKNRIRQMRDARGWSLSELQARTGISRSYLNDIERGRRDVNGRVLETLAKTFGVNSLDLLEEGAERDSARELAGAILRLSAEDRETVVALVKRLSKAPD